MVLSSLSPYLDESDKSDESSVPCYRYDVFLSFRGEDTRKGIIFNLYDEFQRAGCIRTFKDDEGLEIGMPISPNLLRAIKESRLVIVVLSSNYAYSTWCLDELVSIFRCMEGKDRILPLFYNVDPSDVRNQRGSFGVALSEFKKNPSQDPEKVKQWRNALRKVGEISGWDTRKYRSEKELVKHIVEFVCRKLKKESAGVPEVPRLVVIEDEPRTVAIEDEPRTVAIEDEPRTVAIEDVPRTVDERTVVIEDEVHEVPRSVVIEEVLRIVAIEE